MTVFEVDSQIHSYFFFLKSIVDYDQNMKVSRIKKNKYFERCTNSIFIYVYACYRFKDDWGDTILTIIHWFLLVFLNPIY